MSPRKTSTCRARSRERLARTRSRSRASPPRRSREASGRRREKTACHERDGGWGVRRASRAPGGGRSFARLRTKLPRTSGMSPHAMSRRLRWRGRDRPRCQSLQVPSACAGFCCISRGARGPMTKTPIDTNPATKLSWWQLVLIGVFTKRLVFSQTSKKIPALENLEDRSRKPRNRENHKPRDPWSRTSPHGRAVYEFVKIAKHQLTPINTKQTPIKHQSRHQNTTLTPKFCRKHQDFAEIAK